VSNPEDLTGSLHCDGAIMKRQCRAAEFIDHTQSAPLNRHPSMDQA
jgi:hypothetical protein